MVNNQNKTAPMTMIQALRSAMDVMLERDNNVLVFGPRRRFTLVAYSVVPKACKEIRQIRAYSMRRFPKAASSGGDWYGCYGLRPALRFNLPITFYPAYDQIVSEAARLRFRSAGDFTAPLTIRTPCGGGILRWPNS